MKKRALDKAYEEIDAKYKDMSEEDMKKEMETLKKEITGKEKALENLDGEAREKMKKDLEKKNNRLKNLEGYSKNKTQISKIIDYRGRLEAKLANVIAVKDDSKKAYAEAKKEFVEASKLLKDENKIKETLAKDLEAKIGKCNLAWRTLFTNKTWDDIQLRAKQTKGRFTRKKDEEIIEEPIEIEDKEIKEQIGKNVRKIQEEQKEKKNLPAKVTTWTKIKNFFKSIPAKIKEKFGKEDVMEEEKPTKQKSTKQQKADFLDALRQNVDVDYREAVKKAKEQKYIDQHKAKSKEEK